MGLAGLGDEGGDYGGAEGFVDGFELVGVAEDADLGGGDPAGGAVGEVGGVPGAVGGAAGYGEGGADQEVGAGGAVGRGVEDAAAGEDAEGVGTVEYVKARG